MVGEPGRPRWPHKPEIAGSNPALAIHLKKGRGSSHSVKEGPARPSPGCNKYRARGTVPRMRNALLLLTLILLCGCEQLFVGEALAQVPYPDPNSDKYLGPLLPMGHAFNYDADEEVVLRVAGGTYTDERDAWCIPLGSLVVAQAHVISSGAFVPSRACVCFALEDEESIFTMSSGDSCGNADDSHASIAAGQGVCFTVIGRRDIKLDKAYFPSYSLNAIPPTATPAAPGSLAVGACTQTIDLARDPWAGGNRGAPCRVAGDCVDGAGAAGTCTAGAVINCAYMYTESVVATEATDGSVEVER